MPCHVSYKSSLIARSISIRDQITRRLLRVRASLMLSGVMSALIITGCAAAGPFDPEGLGPRQADRIGQICHQTMGLEPGEGQFDLCVGSLSRELRGEHQASALIAARRGCLGRGLPVGSPALAE